MRREGDYYVLIGYEKVWKLLGINKLKFREGKRHRFYKIIDHSTWSLFKQSVIEDILGFQVERKKAQIRRRLNYAGVSKDVKHSTLFSAESTAKLLGYRSRTSGSKYRDKLFDVIKEPLRLRLKYTSDKLPYFQYECKKIRINVIYHEG